MFGPVRAVIVDDTPSHLFNISAGFSAAGIPCTPYWYDRSEISLKKKLKPSPPEGGHEFLRVIFTDLNLDESTGGIAEAIGAVINVVLAQLIASDGGPYALVFWTGVSFTIDEIRDEINERLKVMDILLPIAIDGIKKGKFLTVPSSDAKGEDVLNRLFNDTFEKDESLKDEVIRILDKHGLLRMLSEWESRAIHAAGKSTNNLFNAAKLGVSDEDDMTSVLQKVSGLIALEVAGKSAALSHTAKAFDAAMLDVLVDSFSQSVSDDKYSKIVENELKDVISSKITIDKSEQIMAKLNTMFHIDRDMQNVCVDDRGVVIDLKDANNIGILIDIDDYCCWEDYFWEPSKGNISNLSPKISKEMENAFCSEMVKIDDVSNEDAKVVINGLRKARVDDQQEKFVALSKTKSEFSKTLRWVLVEAGADCDHAQKKSRTLRYLIGVEVNNKFVEDYVYGGNRKTLRNSALELLGPYDFDGETKYLLVSLKRFVSWQMPLVLPEIDMVYRLRKNIVDFLLNKYAVWSMRPGKTEFK